VMGWTGPLTYRQALVWQAWLDMQWNMPSRSDFYAMQTALEVVRMRLGKKAGRAKMKNMKLKFDERNAALKVSRQQAAMYSQAMWFQRVGMKPRILKGGKLIEQELDEDEKQEREELAGGRVSKANYEKRPAPKETKQK
jgi:hypothetical protein